MPVFLKKTKKLIPSTIHLPASKSESNRVLIIKALSGFDFKIENLSPATDTQTMLKLISSEDKTLDVIDAGTTMRFLTAYCSIRNLNKILTGTERMQERPIGTLVDALRSVGASINYLNKEGFPPVETIEFKEQKNNRISIPGNISSQFISALLMVAPILEKGLTIELKGKISSRPYIEMTLNIMEFFGVTHDWVKNSIQIPPQKYKSRVFKVSPDWSAAGYWYSLVSISEEAELHLPGLSLDSYQGDKVIAQLMENLGVKSVFDERGVTLIKKDSVAEYSWDFSNCPDLAQTAAVTAAVKGVTLHMTGIESLRIKETDRISALQKELGKFGAGLLEVNAGEWVVIQTRKKKIPESCNFETYNDHRMAMALAPLATVTNVNIDDPKVVRKSYPGFWKDLAIAGMDVTIIE